MFWKSWSEGRCWLSEREHFSWHMWWTHWGCTASTDCISWALTRSKKKSMYNVLTFFECVERGGGDPPPPPPQKNTHTLKTPKKTHTKTKKQMNKLNKQTKNCNVRSGIRLLAWSKYSLEFETAHNDYAGKQWKFSRRVAGHFVT